MKKISLSIIACSFLMMSCTSDDLNINREETNSINFELKIGTTSVQNVANINDNTGKIYSDVKSTLNTNISSLTLENIIQEVELTANNNNDFTAISNNYQKIDAAKANEVLNSTDTFSLIESTSFTSNTKNLLIGFTSQLESMNNYTYNDIYNYIVDFESNVINNNVISSGEKDRLLTITSITRYSYYLINIEGDPIRFQKNRPTLHGAITGADSDIATAITMTLVIQAATSNQ